jgi:DNA-directed RNA polymerase sigma subunit (sigma70/sigma32)
MSSYDPIEEYIEQEHEEWFLLAIEEYLATLKPRTRAILKARNLPDPIPYRAIAWHYGVCTQRARQIYEDQLCRMRTKLRALEENYDVQC